MCQVQAAFSHEEVRRMALLLKGKITIDSLSIFTSDIRVSFLQGKSVTTTFRDVCSAYDNVQFPILRNKLHKLKMSVRLSNFIINLLSEKRILRIGGESRSQFWSRSASDSYLDPVFNSAFCAAFDSDSATAHTSDLDEAGEYKFLDEAGGKCWQPNVLKDSSIAIYSAGFYTTSALGEISTVPQKLQFKPIRKKGKDIMK
ncbi:hypothetical protein EVAR_99739_1 [Eumeta japonica]|uniref:Uncharacterized protein n=1 Tax=Eumeta variegata TaxID=151549 RepID=A0A4C1Z510_EUMVA|nr:hypothetical protein EVAR_99739_1 [Eumeta japonica]